jgi:GT2 family glycosyltransferase
VSVDVSVLIVSWNTRDLTLRCLETLPAAAGDVSIEVIVVDNGSRDGTREALAARNGIVLIANEDNRGFAEAVNQAYRVSVAPLVLLLNSDVELPADGLASLVRFLHEYEDAAGVAPLYVDPDGTPQPFNFALPEFATTLAIGSAFVRTLPGFRERMRTHAIDADGLTAPQPVPQPSASCLLLRRSMLPSDHVFDERFPIFFNDVALARSLAEQGRVLWVTPEVEAVHEGHASTRQLGGALKRQYVASVVRTLQDTEPRPRVWLYQTIVLAQGLVLWALRRPSALPLRDLRGAVAGDPGGLPQAPADR